MLVIAVLVVVLGVVLDTLLVGLLYVFIFAALMHFGGGPGRRRCPACQRDGLEAFPTDRPRRPRLATYRCVHCGAGYREQLDGNLQAIPW